MKQIITIVLLVTLMFCALVQAAAEPFLLEYKFTKGEIDKYRLAMDMNMAMPPMNVQMKMVMFQRTLDVLADGSGVVKATMKIESMSIPGAKDQVKQNIPPEQSITMTMSKEGQVLKIEGLTGLAMPGGMATPDLSKLFGSMSGGGIFAGKPVEVGESWKNTIPVPFGGGQMSAVSSLVAANEPMWSQMAARIRQTYDGRLDLAEMMKSMAAAIPDAKIRQEMSSMSGSMDFNGTADTLFAPALGKILTQNGNMTASLRINLPASANSTGPSNINTTMQMNFTMTRFK